MLQLFPQVFMYIVTTIINYKSYLESMKAYNEKFHKDFKIISKYDNEKVQNALGTKGTVNKTGSEHLQVHNVIYSID